MLHEILLSLSGHPSHLLTTSHNSPASIFSPPENALLASLAHLSNLHSTLLSKSSTIASTHPSTICRAVATSIRSVHLAAFQRKILDVEDGILKKDSKSVGAYNIVPLTHLVGEFAPWTRRMEWFLEVVEFMSKGKCSGAVVVDWLCEAMKTGYVDIETVARELVQVAETAWLKQIAAWILYGRIPSFGREDFFVQVVEGDVQEYESKNELLPSFVTAPTAASLLFIGRSLNHIRVKGISSSNSPELDLLSSHLQQLSSLEFPINSANFSRAISFIRLSLSQTTLQRLLPLSKVVEILSLLRQFFLLGRGEFALALIAEADEKIRSRWQRSDNLSYEKREGLENIVIKEGEVSAILARTWATMGLLQGQPEEDQEEDEQLELARELVQLVLTKPTSTPSKHESTSQMASTLASTPFRNLLLSVPVTLSLQIPSPLDLFLTPADIQVYSNINAHLLSIHRAHLRLTDLWKITSLRRDHPAPPGPPYGSSAAGRSQVLALRERARERAQAMRSVWATSSAAVFFLSETEAYLQGEVVQGTWEGFKSWLTGSSPSSKMPKPPPSFQAPENDEDDIWLAAGKSISQPTPAPRIEINHTHTHDPQTLALAHRHFLAHLTSSLLLTTPLFTSPLHHLLLQTDHLVALVHRIHSIWTSLDLESDQGVVDAFSDFHKEEKDIREQLAVVAARVKGAIEELVKGLREVDGKRDGEDGYGHGGDGMLGDGNEYRPRKVGRVDRLLMKLDFGGWFVEGRGQGEEDGEEDDLGSEDEL